jgi:hypothetical protein
MKITAAHPRAPSLLITGRILGAALTSTMGWLHLQLWFHGYREIPVISTLFLLNTVGTGFLLAALVAVPARLRSTTTAITAVFTMGTLAGLILSLTVGLFNVHESLQTPLVPTTLVVESVGVLVLTLTAILGFTSPSPSDPQRTPTLKPQHKSSATVDHAAAPCGTDLYEQTSRASSRR